MTLINVDFDGISEAVDKALAEHNLSESALAEKTGVSQPVLNRIVRREQQAPSVPTLKRLWPYIGKYLTHPVEPRPQTTA